MGNHTPLHEQTPMLGRTCPSSSVETSTSSITFRHLPYSGQGCIHKDGIMEQVQGIIQRVGRHATSQAYRYWVPTTWSEIELDPISMQCEHKTDRSYTFRQDSPAS